MKKQKGFLLIAMTVVLGLIAFYAMTVSYLSVNNSRSMANIDQTTEAFYIAEAGLVTGLVAVANINTGARVACNSVNGAGGFSTGLDNGAYSVTGTTYTTSGATLSAAVGAADLFIPVTTLSGYAPSGDVIVGGEDIRYGGVGSTAAQCSPVAAPCLLVSKRGAVGTYPTSHGSGLTVFHNNCFMSSTGIVPATNPVASRTVARSIVYNQISNLWLVGMQVSGTPTSETILNYNGFNWAVPSAPYNGSRPTGTATGAQIQLNSMYFNSSTDGWAVGNASPGICSGPASSGYLLHFSSGTWTGACSAAGTSGVLNQNLYSVDCVNTTACKAVGASGATTAVFGTYTGTSWTADGLTTGGPPANRVPNVNINDVQWITGTLALAVGDAQGGNETILNWRSGTGRWARNNTVASIGNNNLYGLHCPTTSQCWTVGAAGTIAKWVGPAPATAFTGAGFTVNANVAGLTLRDVYCYSTAPNINCWAVGDYSGGVTLVQYTGATNTWARVTASTDSSITSQGTINLTKIYCPSTTSCWAVGANATQTAGFALYWNGTTWFDWSGGLYTQVDGSTWNPLNVPTAVGGVTGVTASIQNLARQFQWEEVFN